MNLFSLRFLFGAVVASFLTLSAAAQMPNGMIKAARVEGVVTKTTATGEVEIKNGDLLVTSDVIQTGEKGSVVLVFQNGSTVRIAPGSKLRIDKFLMDPLADPASVANATEEASPSQTELNLEFGEIVGNVKKLKGQSNYTIKTPVGAAGIRGTTFRIVFRPTGDGRAFNFQVTTAEGLVVFEGTSAGSGAPVEIGADQEIVVTVVVENGNAQITGPVQTQQISAEAQQQIQQVVEQVTQAVQQTDFTPSGNTPQNPPTPPGPPETPAGPDPDPVPPVQTPPQLTGGAGKG
ncbi:MAG TPA: FecR family protein [Opitutaceae bacterium]|nr:FecR family protein [Opitutaceae bacterium]